MKLNAKLREKKEKLDKKTIPAVVYGSDFESRSLKLDKVEFEKVYEEVGESSLIDLSIGDDKSVKVLVKEVQNHPFKNIIFNVDFHQVNMTEKITTEIPLEFIGESKAKKEEGALIMQNLDSIEVECLPSDLVNSIEVDLSSLNEFGDSIHVKDLKVPEGMEILAEAEEVVVSAIEPKEEEEVEEEKTPEEIEAEAIKEKTEEGEEKNEGEGSDEEKEKEKKE